MNHTSKLIIIILFIALVSVCSAIPNTGAASDITSNGLNITCTGVTGTDAWISWGQNQNGGLWKTENFTATAGTANARVWGSPLRSSTTYYGKCCDSSGCGSTVSFTILPAATLTVPPIDAGWNNITGNHFNLIMLPNAIFMGLTSIVPIAVFFGVTISVIIMGYWRANKSLRLVSILFGSIGAVLFAVYRVPGPFQQIGMIFLAGAVAGIIVSILRK